MTHLVFAIDGGQLVWLAAHETAELANEHVSSLRPDGTTDETGPARGPNDPDETGGANYEFAFAVPATHFASFV